MIDWKKYPEAAQVTVNYLDASGDTINFDVFAPPTQTKTVADAVEYCNHEWVSAENEYVKGASICTKCKTITETATIEQESEKWTHVYCGEKCKAIGEPDSFGRVVILTESDAYFLDKPETLKPIKPTLTKAQAWDRLNETKCSVHEFGARLIKLQKDYDII